MSYIIVLLLFLISESQGQILDIDSYDYCDPKLNLCDVPLSHTMCKYPSPEMSSRCSPNLQEPLSPSEKNKILFLHNRMRSKVATGGERNKNRKLPTSSNMRQMYWDNELELIASRWAEQCVSSESSQVYDKCRNTRRFRVSQNIGTRRVNGTSIDKQAPYIVGTWSSKGFDSALVDKFDPSKEKSRMNQFANMIWADTYAIGCARVLFQERIRDTFWTIERLVCNYGPGGGEIGTPVYKRGAPCQNCPTGTKCSSIAPGLCAIQGNERSEIQHNQGVTEDVKSVTKINEVTENQDVNNEEDHNDGKLDTSMGMIPEKDDNEGTDTCESEEQCRREDSTTATTPWDHRLRIDEIFKADKYPPDGTEQHPNKQTKTGRLSAVHFIEKRKRDDMITGKEEFKKEGLKNGDRCECFLASSSSMVPYVNITSILYILCFINYTKNFIL